MPPKKTKVTQKRGKKRPLPVDDDDSSTSLSTVSEHTGSVCDETEFESFVADAHQPGVSWDSLKERTKFLVERIKLLGTDFESKYK